MINRETIAKRLKKLRTDQGWSIAGVSLETGIPKGTIESAETGRHNQSIEVLLAIAKVHTLTVSELIGEKI